LADGFDAQALAIQNLQDLRPLEDGDDRRYLCVGRTLSHIVSMMRCLLKDYSETLSWLKRRFEVVTATILDICQELYDRSTESEFHNA
jgi:hypothetical protein